MANAMKSHVVMCVHPAAATQQLKCCRCLSYGHAAVCLIAKTAFQFYPSPSKTSVRQRGIQHHFCVCASTAQIFSCITSPHTFSADQSQFSIKAGSVIAVCDTQMFSATLHSCECVTALLQADVTWHEHTTHWPPTHTHIHHICTASQHSPNHL